MKPRVSYKFIIFSTVYAFFLASIFHFVYGWFGPNLILGLFFPVNESVFEHLKLILYPILLAWICCYKMIDIPNSINLWTRFTGAFISIEICKYTVLSVYYILYGGFLFESDVVNITALFVGMLLGQIVASRIVTLYKIPKWIGICSLLLLIGMGILLAYFSLNPLPYPIMISN